MEPTMAVRRIREDLTLLDILIHHAKILLGHCWRPPDLGWAKINCDGATDTCSGAGGAGGVARSASSFIAVWSKPLPGMSDLLVDE